MTPPASRCVRDTRRRIRVREARRVMGWTALDAFMPRMYAAERKRPRGTTAAYVVRMMHAIVDEYLAERTNTFERRSVRYRAALTALKAHGLTDTDTLDDIGAGWTEPDVVLRVDGSWRGRYIPVDLGTCGTDLETSSRLESDPPRDPGDSNCSST